jgi:hypothetical protein
LRFDLTFDLPFDEMPFQIKPIRESLVRTSIPRRAFQDVGARLQPGLELGTVIRVFRRLDPALWRESGYNPASVTMP